MNKQIQELDKRLEVRPYELCDALEFHGAKASVLSLDCFDTVLWRRTSAPHDVFYSLQSTAGFQKYGLDARLRMRTEGQVREKRYARHQDSEITLEEVYRALVPNLSDEELLAFTEAELAAEMNACIAHPQSVELIRRAKARGMRVVIVSDIYLSDDQLTRLLKATLPEDAFACIDRIWASSSYRKGKTSGLFDVVLDELKVKPEQILHIGDNTRADFQAPRNKGLKALRLRQNEEVTEEYLRLETSAVAIIDTDVRHQHPLPSPFHGVFASKPVPEDPGSQLGRYGIGPMMYAFGRFVLDEVQSLRDQGASPKPVFLLRDGYLPHEVCRSIAGEDVGEAISLSRFVAYACSFRDSESIYDYLTRMAGSKRFEDICRQLLLSEATSRQLIAKARTKSNAPREFMNRAMRPKVVEEIKANSAAYRQRLYRYLEQQCDLKRGDTLVFVDLGYEGTAQRLLEPIFLDELGVHVRGLYLMVVGTPGWQTSRKGLVDPSNCDNRAILALVRYVASLETICCADAESVVNYDEDGQPIFTQRTVADGQFERTRPVQEACREFVKEAQSFFEKVGPPSAAELRHAAMGQLGRLFFMPTHSEVRYLEGFQLDMNLATDDTFDLFNSQAGLEGLRRRGMFFMERSLKSMRMNYPTELRHAGLELATTLFTQERLCLRMKHDDFSMRREEIGVLVDNGSGQSSFTAVEAKATHDGFFAVHLPMGGGDFSLGLTLGQRFSWIQIEAIQVIDTDHLWAEDESLHTKSHMDAAVFQDMKHHGNGILECLNPNSFIFIPAAPTDKARQRLTCRVVFRPLSYREEPAEQMTAKQQTATAS